MPAGIPAEDRLEGGSEQLVTAAVPETGVTIKTYHTDIGLPAYGLTDTGDAVGAKATTQLNRNTAVCDEINGNTTGFGV